MLGITIAAISPNIATTASISISVKPRSLRARDSQGDVSSDQLPMSASTSLPPGWPSAPKLQMSKPWVLRWPGAWYSYGAPHGSSGTRPPLM